MKVTNERLKSEQHAKEMKELPTAQEDKTHCSLLSECEEETKLSIKMGTLKQRNKHGQSFMDSANPKPMENTGLNSQLNGNHACQHKNEGLYNTDLLTRASMPIETGSSKCISADSRVPLETNEHRTKKPNGFHEAPSSCNLTMMKNTPAEVMKGYANLVSGSANDEHSQCSSMDNLQSQGIKAGNSSATSTFITDGCEANLSDSSPYSDTREEKKTACSEAPQILADLANDGNYSISKVKLSMAQEARLALASRNTEDVSQRHASCRSQDNVLEDSDEGIQKKQAAALGNKDNYFSTESERKINKFITDIKVARGEALEQVEFMQDENHVYHIRVPSMAENDSLVISLECAQLQRQNPTSVLPISSHNKSTNLQPSIIEGSKQQLEGNPTSILNIHLHFVKEAPEPSPSVNHQLAQDNATADGSDRLGQDTCDWHKAKVEEDPSSGDSHPCVEEDDCKLDSWQMIRSLCSSMHEAVALACGKLSRSGLDASTGCSHESICTTSSMGSHNIVQLGSDENSREQNYAQCVKMSESNRNVGLLYVGSDKTGENPTLGTEAGMLQPNTSHIYKHPEFPSSLSCTSSKSTPQSASLSKDSGNGFHTDSSKNEFSLVQDSFCTCNWQRGEDGVLNSDQDTSRSMRLVQTMRDAIHQFDPSRVGVAIEADKRWQKQQRRLLCMVKRAGKEHK